MKTWYCENCGGEFESVTCFQYFEEGVFQESYVCDDCYEELTTKADVGVL